MNRRELLKNGLLAGTLSMIPFSNVLAETKNVSEKQKMICQVQKDKIGRLDLFILTDGYIHEET
jgi:hypothetical protein